MALGSGFHSPHFGRERLAARSSIPRHRHWDGYITVVVAGGYQEAGFDGRWNLTAGDVVVHRRNDAHLDHIGPKGVDLVNLPLPSGLALPAAFRIEDPDALAHLAERSPFEAALAIRPSSEIAAQSDWPDKLALDLMTNCGQRLGNWAAAMGLAAETLSRGFRATYGVTPARYRAERRAQLAIEMIVQSDAGLASIAVDCGYADQSHLNREIVALTGRSPGKWRRSISFKNGKQASA